MVHAYCRVSTDGQTCENQLIAIRARYPDAVAVMEIVSGASESKPSLDALLARLQPADTLVIVALDRLTRTLLQGSGLIKELSEKKVTLISLREGLDLSTAMGKAMAQMIFIFAEMELTSIRERTKAGVARARSEGKQIGRKKGATHNQKGELIKPSTGRPTVDHSDITPKLQKLRSKGLSFRDIADLEKMSVGQVHKLLTMPKVG